MTKNIYGLYSSLTDPLWIKLKVTVTLVTEIKKEQYLREDFYEEK